MESDRSRVQRLLTARELGDRRPSLFLHQRYPLLRSERSGSQDTIPREFFLSKVPKRMRAILVAVEETSLDHLVVQPDRMADYSVPTVCAIETRA